MRTNPKYDTQPLPRSREITLNVPQGIGDIFWVYQKFAPHFDRIHFNVAHTHPSPIETRSNGWLQLLPKCGRVNFVQRPEYNPNAVPPPMREIMARRARGDLAPIDYAANHQLEQSIRLEAIDKDFEVEWDVPMRAEIDPVRPPPYQDYIILYISGTTRHAEQYDVWSLACWVEFASMFHARWLREHPLDARAIPMMIIGAEYDKPMPEMASEMLTARGIENTVWLNRSPLEVAWLLKNAKFLLGYQSGLGIIADNFSTPQIHIYFNYLEKLKYSWCQPAHAGRIFQAWQFKQSPEEILSEWKMP